MISQTLILDTIVKWLIPVVCAGLLAWFVAHLFKPFKAGSQLKDQQDWDKNYKDSEEPKKVMQQVKEDLEEITNKADQAIINKIDNLNKEILDQKAKSKQYHDQVDESMKLITDGVRDAHLQNLISTCETYIRRGYITSTELDVYQSRYNLYKKLGGNGHMEPWDAKIKALPNEPLKQTKIQTNINTSIPKTHI